ncbi:hypothetical protein [Streptomyces cinereoruber]|uniref:hypothetical protein n=1 Tax=Streptomyces cinereoruber TaxID=67260 RepID=UPI00363102B6
MRRELVLVCRGCAGRIYGDDGYLWVDTEEVNTAQERWAGYRERSAERRARGRPTDLLDMIDCGELVYWQAHHATCDPTPREAHYRIEARKLRTRADLLEWSAHLMGKMWLPRTDWQDVMCETRAGGRRFAPVGTPQHPIPAL